MELYWHIIKWDGEIIKVKPSAAPVVQKLLEKGDGFIKTATRSIAVKDIKDFVQSGERYTDQKLIEGAASAFSEPVFTEDGAIKCKWVKKTIPRREWEKTYAANGYKLLENLDSYTVVAMAIPIHLINYQRVEDCTELEIMQLTGH